MTKRSQVFIGLMIGVSLSAIMIGVIPTSAQTTPPLDDTELILPIERTGVAFTEIIKIGRSTVDGSIWTVITNGTSETANRFATPLEQNLYLAEERLEKIERWVNNRTTELQTCETDAAAALALGNWTAQGNGVQNAIIASLLQCNIDNSKVNRKTINALLTELNELDPNGF